MPADETETTETSTTETVVEEESNQAAESTEPAETTANEDKIVFVDEKFEFAIPEGTEVDQESLKSFKEFSVDQKLPAETAQTVLDYLFDSKAKSEAFQKEAREQAIKDNQKTIKEDPEIGGEHYKTVQEAVDRIALKYGGQDFKDQVVDAGLKDDPMFLRFMRNLNVILSEDRVLSTAQVVGNPPEKTYEQLAEEMFGDKIK